MSSSMGVVVAVKGKAAQKILDAISKPADPKRVQEDAESAKKLLKILNKK